jgi:hypothetical protein
LEDAFLPVLLTCLVLLELARNYFVTDREKAYQRSHESKWLPFNNLGDLTGVFGTSGSMNVKIENQNHGSDVARNARITIYHS